MTLFSCGCVADGLDDRISSSSEHVLQKDSALQDYHRDELARLEPVYLNAPLQKMLDIHTTEEYTFIMEKQLMRNPMMVLLFENCVR